MRRANPRTQREEEQQDDRVGVFRIQIRRLQLLQLKAALKFKV